MVEDTPQRKYHKLTKKQKILIALFTLFILVVIMPIFGYFYYKYAVKRPSQTGDEVTYEVKSGYPLTTISEELFREGAINSQFLLNFYIYINRLDTNIQAGVYVIPAGTSIVELVDMLQHGVNDTQVTFLEGWRVDEFGREATRILENVDYKAFVKMAEEKEGFLFPDTYMINADIQEADLLDFLTDTFDKKTEGLFSQDALDRLGLTREEIITLASIVEREVRDPADREIVAGILIKRYKEDMLLGADATTQYATAQDKYCMPAECVSSVTPCALPEDVDQCRRNLTEEQAMEIDWWPSDITVYDLDSDSPYNTRKVLGLPPGPICNPSLSSIEAVLNYKKTPYYYYIHDAEGVTHYAITSTEHQMNVDTHLR